MSYIFTPRHRGGSGPPLVCLHGFTGTWRMWELVLPALERHHDVLAPTLPGHAGGPRLREALSAETLPDAVESAMDQAGFERAHLVGNSLGGFLALQLAARGRASSVVALAPAGGWGEKDAAFHRTLDFFIEMRELMASLAPHADAIAATPEGRRRATEMITTSYEHIPADLVAHLIVGVAGCTGASRMVDYARQSSWELAAGRIDCPVRIVWGTDDRLLPWPAGAARYRHEWLPHADWVVLDGIGHCPQLDVPLETAQLILGFSAR
ncbi:MAG: alpha/beta fold hydrolase [Solirubrobacterales bacterium]|nr:alpha/beta fold hydrolase [Solirubrobacterales bacterium]